MEQKIQIKLVREGAQVPAYATSGSAGLDVAACFKFADDIKCPEGIASVVDDTLFISPGSRVLIPTGIAVALPEGTEIQVRSRSGLALKQGLSVLNAPGTIDSDYRGEIGVILTNSSNHTQQIKSGDRIAQLVFAKVERAEFELVESLDETQRGAGGYGSTGK